MIASGSPAFTSWPSWNTHLHDLAVDTALDRHGVVGLHGADAGEVDLHRLGARQPMETGTGALTGGGGDAGGRRHAIAQRRRHRASHPSRYSAVPPPARTPRRRHRPERRTAATGSWGAHPMSSMLSRAIAASVTDRGRSAGSGGQHGTRRRDRSPGDQGQRLREVEGLLRSAVRASSASRSRMNTTDAIGWTNGKTRFWIGPADAEGRKRKYRVGDVGFHHYAFQLRSRKDVDAVAGVPAGTRRRRSSIRPANTTTTTTPCSSSTPTGSSWRG